MEDVGGEDRGSASVEAGVEVAVFAKQPGGAEDSVDRLEIVGEVGRVSRDLPEEADVDGVGEDGADQRQDEEPEPVEAVPGKEPGVATRSGDEGEQGQARGEGPEHLPHHHHHRIERARADEAAVEDRKDCRQEGTEEGQQQSGEPPPFKPGDEQNADGHEAAKRDLERPHLPPFEQGLGEGGE